MQLWESDVVVGAISFSNTYSWSDVLSLGSIIIGNTNPTNVEARTCG